MATRNDKKLDGSGLVRLWAKIGTRFVTQDALAIAKGELQSILIGDVRTYDGGMSVDVTLRETSGRAAGLSSIPAGQLIIAECTHIESSGISNNYTGFRVLSPGGGVLRGYGYTRLYTFGYHIEQDDVLLIYCGEDHCFLLGSMFSNYLSRRYISSITRSGNIFTATRGDGTTFTFSQQNSTYTPAALGFGYGTCATAATTVAKVATLAGYALVTGGMVAVRFTNAVPANATLNINSKGAKPIYFNNAAITAGVIRAGDTATFVYDGTNYRLLSTDSLMSRLAALESALDGKTLITK